MRRRCCAATGNLPGNGSGRKSAINRTQIRRGHIDRRTRLEFNRKKSGLHLGGPL
jgi:hypothetical protein